MSSGIETFLMPLSITAVSSFIDAYKTKVFKYVKIIAIEFSGLKVGDFVQQCDNRKYILGYFKNPVNSSQVGGKNNLVKVPNLDKVFESSDKKYCEERRQLLSQHCEKFC